MNIEEINQAWKEALTRWHHPSVPKPITASTPESFTDLGDLGAVLQQELAFMKYPEAQTYLNIKKIEEEFSADARRGLTAICEHEIGHRFCPYDLVTQIVLEYKAKKALENEKFPYDEKQLIHTIYNLFADMCINTQRSRKKNSDIPWAYQQLSAREPQEETTLVDKLKRVFNPQNNKKKSRVDSPLWRVYAKSMELAWKEEILPADVKLSEEEMTASTQLSELFKENYFDKRHWPSKIMDYARIIFPFLKDKKNDGNSSLDGHEGSGLGDTKKLDDKTKKELAKRLAEIGSNGLPTNPKGMKEFQEVMAGLCAGTDPKEASIFYYDVLSEAYNVCFVTQPFGKPRQNPFQPIKWTPGKSVSQLDIPYSLETGGRIIPGVNTYGWNTRRRDSFGGVEEVVLNLDLYLDSSGSMPDPTTSISLPVLAGFVVAKKAHRKGAMVRGTNFSGDGQYLTVSSTKNNLFPVYEVLVKYFNGGTVLPINILNQGSNPRQVLIITDGVLSNAEQTAQAIKQLKQQDARNKVTIYALHPVNYADYLKSAGAEVIWGNTTDIFQQVIGKGDEIYSP
jgi:hypothetical protein